MRKIHRRVLGVAAVAALLLLLAVPKLIQLRQTHQTEPVADSSGPLRVTVYDVHPDRLSERLATTGTVRANEEVEIVSEISGKVDAIHFREGSRVEAGELLVEIDDSELEAERQRALHRVGLAERAEARQRQLLDDGVISSEAYDVSLGELNVLRAELQLIEAQLLKTKIRAPFGGVIGLRWVSVGSFLSPQTPIASLNDLDPVKVDFTVPEKYASLLGPGDDMTFHVDGSDRSFTGTVYAVEPSVDTATRSLRLRARCPNPDGVLVPGAFANVQLIVRSVENALAVPSIAVIPELGGKKVFVFEGGTAEARRVETGIRTEDMVQVTRGLEAGDLVITSPIQQVAEGMSVILAGPAAEVEAAP